MATREGMIAKRKGKSKGRERGESESEDKCLHLVYEENDKSNFRAFLGHHARISSCTILFYPTNGFDLIGDEN